MNKSDAWLIARQLVGPDAIARDAGPRGATTPAERVAARVELAKLKADKPHGFGARVREIECIPFRQRYAIAKDVGYATRIYGTGDTWEDAIAVAKRVLGS